MADKASSATLLASATNLHRQGRLQEAEAIYREILTLEPQQAEVLHLLGIIALQSGRPEAAIDPIQRSLMIDPRQAPACLNLSVALQQLRRTAEALACLEQALQLAPEFPDALNNHGGVLVELGRPEEALVSLDRALTLRSDFPLALNNRGSALRALKRPEEALKSFEAALAYAPDNAEFLANCGNACADLEQPARALQFFDRAIQRLRDPEVLRSRGDVLLSLQRPAEALASYQAALELQPAHRDALFGAGMSLLALKKLDEAQGYFGKLCELEPDYPYARAYQLFARWQVCDWTDGERYRQGLVDAVARGAKADVPFSFLAVSDSAATQLQCARTFAADRYPSIGTHTSYRVPRHERIRLAYVSGDLRNHIVARLLVGVFEKHDRQRFEVTAIALRPADPHPFGQRVVASFDRFIDVSERNDAEVAALMRSMEIDIAIDLAGFTEGGRTGILARRCAPIQINCLGFPGTMGAPYVDYIIADEFVIPQHLQAHYTENPVYLPDCFQATDDRRPLPETISRAQVGLPERAIVCCSLNNSYKYSAQMLDIWARLILRVPGSVLWLIADDPKTEANLRREAAHRGLSPDRLVLSGRVPYEEHLQRLSCADLFLDTLPFNAGATASDVLWAGVPLLTCTGEAFAARMAGSLLHAAGLSELVTSDLSEYERRALELVTEPARLAALRERLQGTRGTCALFNTEHYCRNLESAFEIMWRLGQEGKAPSPITIEPGGPA